MKLLAGNSNLPLARAIADYLELPLTDASVRRFADEEVFVEIQENVRGEDVFVVQSTSFPTNDNLMELLICIDALKRASAKRITAVIPYFGYARQDRKPGPRTPISAKLVANLITVAGADRVLTMDLHAGQIQGFFDIPTDNLWAAPVMAALAAEGLRLEAILARMPAPIFAGLATATLLTGDRSLVGGPILWAALGALYLAVVMVGFGAAMDHWRHDPKNAAELAKKLEEVGCATVMPLAAPIGDWGLTIENYQPPPGTSTPGDWQIASEGGIEALGERSGVRLRRGVLPHADVHRGRGENGPAEGEPELREDIVGESVRELGERVRRERRDHEQVGFDEPGGDDVRLVAVAPGGAEEGGRVRGQVGGAVAMACHAGWCIPPAGGRTTAG